jgi:hypothetical protein
MSITAVRCDDVICLKYAQDNWVISEVRTALSAVHRICNSLSNGFLYIRTVSENFACFTDNHNVYSTYFSHSKTAFLQKYF